MVPRRREDGQRSGNICDSQIVTPKTPSHEGLVVSTQSVTPKTPSHEGLVVLIPGKQGSSLELLFLTMHAQHLDLLLLHQ